MIEEHIHISGPYGTIEASLVRPDIAAAMPGVVCLTDIFGIRPASIEVSKEIAAHGYVVLTPNLFYRTTALPLFDFEPDFTNERTKKRVGELTAPLTPSAMAQDAGTYVDYLAAQSFVSNAPMGSVGFCFSGKFALAMAAARPDRVAAAASFHGGGLYTDSEASPHRLLSQIQAHLYFAHASNDRIMPADAIEKFNDALRAWGGRYESEIYEGARHGWMVPSGGAYDAAAAKRGMAKLIALLDETLRAPAPA